MVLDELTIPKKVKTHFVLFENLSHIVTMFLCSCVYSAVIVSAVSTREYLCHAKKCNLFIKNRLVVT